MEYMIKLDGPGGEIYLKMPGTVTDEEWKKRLDAAAERYRAVKKKVSP
jgi:hypothetical protein